MHLGDLPLDVLRIFGETRLLESGDFLADLDRLAFLRDAGRQPPAAGEGQREALLLGDREEPQRLAAVVLAADQFPVTPRPHQGNPHRENDPEGLLH